MIRRLGHTLSLLCIAGGVAVAGPSTIPASLKTLESVLSSVDLPTPSVGAGVQPLHNAVAAANGLLQSLDPNGLSGASSKRPETNEAEGRTGIILGRMDGYPVIAGTLPGTPAHNTSLREGDRLLKIGETKVAANAPLASLQIQLRGKTDELIELQVLHADGSGVASYKLKLAAPVSRVHVRELPGKVGFVQLLGPDALTLAEYKLKLGKFEQEPLIGVVLDFRGATKGGAEEAVSLCEPFLDPGAIATVLETSSRESALRTSQSSIIKVPLVVLVSPSTRGAAEIAAGALQARRRAVLLGGPTQGTASAYRQIEKAGVFLTIPSQLVQLSNGTLLSGSGLRPDIEVEAEAVPGNLAESLAGQVEAFAKGVKWEPPREKTETDKDLETALEEDDNKDEEKPESEPKKSKEEKEEDVRQAAKDPFHEYALVKRYDPRLVRSVHLLMAASIFSQQKLN